FCFARLDRQDSRLPPVCFLEHADQLARLVTAGVADQIASPTPCRPRGGCKSHIVIPHWARRFLVARLEYKNRDLVLGCLLKQLGPWFLLRVYEFAADELERSGFVRQLKSEG